MVAISIFMKKKMKKKKNYINYINSIKFFSWLVVIMIIFFYFRVGTCNRLIDFAYIYIFTQHALTINIYTFLLHFLTNKEALLILFC